MSFSPLSLAVVVFSIALVVGVFVQVAKRRLLLRYSLLWLLLALIALLCAIFPEIVFSLGAFLGFQFASNFVLFIAVFLLLAIALSLSVVVSKQQIKIKNLVQDLAILKNWIEENYTQRQGIQPCTSIPERREPSE